LHDKTTEGSPPARLLVAPRGYSFAAGVLFLPLCCDPQVCSSQFAMWDSEVRVQWCPGRLLCWPKSWNLGSSFTSV